MTSELAALCVRTCCVFPSPSSFLLFSFFFLQKKKEKIIKKHVELDGGDVLTEEEAVRGVFFFDEDLSVRTREHSVRLRPSSHRCLRSKTHWSNKDKRKRRNNNNNNNCCMNGHLGNRRD